MWNTLREIDVDAIREESERPFRILCAGTPYLAAQLAGLVQTTGRDRYTPVGASPFDLVPLPAAAVDLPQADMLVLVVDGREPLTGADQQALRRLLDLALPLLVVTLYAGQPPAQLSAGGLVAPIARVVAIADPAAPDASDLLAAALLDLLPGELHLAAARRLPALRPILARQVVSTTSLANASYAFASGLPEQIPLLSLPFAAAETLVLTKNQAMMVYRLALAHGAPPEFQSRVGEVLPVIGSAYIWRQIARGMVGLIPVWGLVPKVVIAYAGTYTIGVVAWRWYASGEIVSGDQLRQLSQDAMREGRARAQRLLDIARAQGQPRSGGLRRLLDRARQRLPGRHKEQMDDDRSQAGAEEDAGEDETLP
jgi:uncharacterized protein (DUF697 family)